MGHQAPKAQSCSNSQHEPNARANVEQAASLGEVGKVWRSSARLFGFLQATHGDAAEYFRLVKLDLCQGVCVCVCKLSL